MIVVVVLINGSSKIRAAPFFVEILLRLLETFRTPAASCVCRLVFEKQDNLPHFDRRSPEWDEALEVEASQLQTR
jgi:hypothetical protein